MNGAFFLYLRDPVLETIGIATGALALALGIGAPLSLLVARGGRVGRIVTPVVTTIRAIPDLVLAIVLVVAVGLGPIAGMLALGINYAMVVAKLYAELIDAVPHEPEEALRATGATRSAAFLVGLLPAAWRQLVGFGTYAFDCIIRESVIVGVVGAGGLGAAIVQSINLLAYGQFLGYVLAIALIVWLVDVLSDALRARLPLWVALAALAAIFTAGIASFEAVQVDVTRTLARAPAHLARFIADAFPPEISAKTLATVGHGALETLFVALVGTAVGAACALPLAWIAARPVAFGWMRGTGYRPWSIVPFVIAKIALAVTRSIPVIAVGLVALAFVGLGPKAGAAALILHTMGVLGKLFAESLEQAEIAPAEVLVASGASGAIAALVGLVPGAAQLMAAHLVYRWEWNIRASTILGLIGAGGLGAAIFNAQQLQFYHQLLTYVIAAVVVVLLSDYAGGTLRRRFALTMLER